MATTPQADAISAAMKAIFDQVSPDEPGARRAWDSGQSSIPLTNRQLMQLMLDGLKAAAPFLAPRPAGERIETVIYRDPDGRGADGMRFALFINGLPVDAGEPEIIDPGAGYERHDWDESCEHAAGGASPLAAQVIRDWYADGAETEFITSVTDPAPAAGGES